MVSEKMTIQRAKSGDSMAFESLVLAYEKKVYNMALRYTNNESDALDVSQEVFLRVFRFLPRFNETSQFSTWLYRITINACKDCMRKKSQQNEVYFEADAQDDGFAGAEISDSRYNPENEYERAELRAEIVKGIESLSPQHREIIIMRDIAMMTYDEIAGALSIEIGTVKSRVARARGRLRAFLTGRGNILTAPESNETKDQNVKGGSGRA